MDALLFQTDDGAESAWAGTDDDYVDHLVVDGRLSARIDRSHVLSSCNDIELCCAMGRTAVTEPCIRRRRECGH